MTQRLIYSGQRVTVQCEFRRLGVPTDPTVVQCTSRAPNGTKVVLTYPATNLVRTGIGNFEAYIMVDVGGTWWFRFEAAGIVDAVTEIPLSVEQSIVI